MTEVPRSRLLGWVILVVALATLSYTANIAGGKPPSDVLYQWSTVVGALVQYAIILGDRARDRARGSRRRRSGCGGPHRGRGQRA